MTKMLSFDSQLKHPPDRIEANKKIGTRVKETPIVNKNKFTFHNSKTLGNEINGSLCSVQNLKA